MFLHLVVPVVGKLEDPYRKISRPTSKGCGSTGILLGNNGAQGKYRGVETG